MVLRSRSVIIDGTVLSTPTFSLWKAYEFTHDGSGTVTLPNEFHPGSTRLLVDGLEWYPSWYTEAQDSDNRWTTLQLVCSIPNGAKCLVRYYDAPFVV